MKKTFNRISESKSNFLSMLFTTLFVFPFVVNAVDPSHDWLTIESKNFYIHYAKGYGQLAQKSANLAEKAHTKLMLEIKWQPRSKTHLVISDEIDAANGFAMPINFNRSVLYVTPPDAPRGIEDFDDWLDTLITHEYTHILHLDKVSGGAGVLRNIFGRHFLLFPNAMQPNWFTEGLATYYETDNVQKIGRGQSALFKMMMRTEVENGLKPVNQINLPIRSWPMGTDAYLYGVHFYQFIEEKYGHSKINHLVQNYSNNVIPFMINRNAEQVFGKNISELWQEFSIWLDGKYRDEKGLVNGELVVEGDKITNFGYSTGEIGLTENNELFYIAKGAFDHTAVMKVSNGQHEKVTEVNGSARLSYQVGKGLLVTQLEYCDEYNVNSDIYSIAINDDDLETLTECGRYRHAAWSPDGRSMAAVKINKGVSELVLLNESGERLKTVWQGNATDIVSQISWSPDGNKILAAVFRRSNGWNIEEFNLDTAQWDSLTNDRYIDMYPSYSESGKAILFSSERDGRYQIYRYRKESELLEQLTRVSSGAFNPQQKNSESTLYYVGYNANGYDVYQLDKADVLSTSAIETNYKIESKTVEVVNISKAENYSALSTIYPRWWFPYIAATEDRNEYGLTTSGNDALGLHNYFMTLAYDSENEWLVGSLSYAYANRFSIGYMRSTSILLDENGDFAVARNDDDVFMSFAINNPSIESKFSLQVGALVNESSDGTRAPGVAEVIDTKDNLVGGALLFNNAKSYIRSISLNDGRRIRLLAETSDTLESDFAGEVYTLDWREYIGLGQQHVLGLRAVQAWGTDRPKLFRLGGEDNDYGVFDFINPVSEPLFGERQFALRGYDEGHPELAGRRMQLASIEWRFPGSLIERGWMTPPLGIVQWSGSIFAEAGAAYTDSSPEEYYSSAGFEIHADVNLFYGLTSRMRIGYAKGLDEFIGEDRVYFNLGSSF